MTTIDERSQKNIATLAPQARPLAERFLRAANEAAGGRGITVKIISGTRTYAEQNTLYGKGRTAPGPKVTNARGGYSNHNFGVAFDIGLFQGKTYLEESPIYTELGKLGVALGLEWGGRWKSFPDEPHFQIKTGLTLAQMRQIVSEGRTVV